MKTNHQLETMNIGIEIVLGLNALIAFGDRPSAEDIERGFNAVDLMHDSGCHLIAHLMDERVCQWSELLLDD